MSVEIVGNYGKYATVYTSGKKNVGEIDNAVIDENGIKTSTVELKTSKPGVTKTEQIKTGFKNVNDYSKYLQEKYRYMNTGTTSMRGIPTTVTVSPAFLIKCMNDPEKAKYLEENLAAIPDCVKSQEAYTKMMQGSPVCTYVSYSFDADGNITMASGCTNDPDGKIARENAARKAKEKREVEKKAAEKRKENKIEEEKTARRRAEKAEAEKHIAGAGNGEVNYTFTGNSVRSIAESLIFAMSLGPDTGMSGFDLKA